MLELGEHCHTHIIPRLKKVIDIRGQGRHYRGGSMERRRRVSDILARALLITMDKYSQAVINKEYNAAMTQAM